MECHLSRITVHYESIGHGRPLVVLPGWPDDWTVPADYLEPVMRSRPGWRRIYLDLPGRGRTEGASWITTNDQFLEIVLQVLDRLIPGERFVVAGHSAGGYLARAVLHRRIALVDGLLQVVPEFPDDDDEELPDRSPARFFRSRPARAGPARARSSQFWRRLSRRGSSSRPPRSTNTSRHWCLGSAGTTPSSSLGFPTP